MSAEIDKQERAAHYTKLRAMVEEMQDGPALTIEQALKSLLDAVMAGDWHELEAGCDGTGPVVQAYRALGKPLPEAVVDYIDPESDDEMDWDDEDEESSEEEDDGISGQDRESYSDDQDRETYTVKEAY